MLEFCKDGGTKAAGVVNFVLSLPPSRGRWRTFAPEGAPSVSVADSSLAREPSRTGNDGEHCSPLRTDN